MQLSPAPTPQAITSETGPAASALQLSENSYVSLNPMLTSVSVMSLSDNNVIRAGDRTLTLDLYESASLVSADEPVITPGRVISGTGPFELGRITSGTDTPVHAAMQGTAFAMPHVRYNHVYHMISPQGDASVQINVGGVLHQRSLPEGEVVEFETGEINGRVGSVITSDVPILVSHRAKSSRGSSDASPMPPAANELWGVCSRYAQVSAVEDSTLVRVHSSDGSSNRRFTLNAGERRSVCAQGSDDTRQGKGAAVHVVADKPVSAIQIADGDGVDQTAFYPTALLNSRFGIPKDSQYIAITCASADTDITLYRPNTDPVTASCSANGDIPGKAYFGNGDVSGRHIPQGSYLESSKPIHVIYEVTGSEDEHNLVGAAVLPSDSNGFLSWDVENSPVGELNRRTPGIPFDDVNRFARITTDIVDTVPGGACHSGSRCMRLGYTRNESGVELQVNDLIRKAGGPTKSLFVRKYEYFGDEWQTNWPVGLKTSRYFTDVKGRGAAYMSEKLIYQTYGGDPNDLFGRGMNNAIGNLDLKTTYAPDQLFGNGLPYIRTGHWYKFETWMVLDSAVDANDGVLKIWIDDELVYSNTSVPWRSTRRGVTRGGNSWASMWFGGNYSGATFGGPSETLYRYIDDLYLSTTLDR
jgi:hypothetical protein